MLTELAKYLKKFRMIFQGLHDFIVQSHPSKKMSLSVNTKKEKHTNIPAETYEKKSLYKTNQS